MAQWMLLLPAFALVLLRVSGIMLAAPLYSSSAIPARIKIGLVVLVSLIVFPMVRPTMGSLPATLLGTAVAAACELVIGLVIGLSVNLLFTGVELAAQVVAQQMGLGLARVFNPTIEDETGVLEQFYLLLGLVLLLTFNGHQLVLSGVLDSFRALPPMTVTVQPEMMNVLRGLLAGSYVLALKIAAPAMVVFFLVSMMMGFLGRTVPQINILVVGFPLRVGVGLAVLVGSLGATAVVFSEGYRRTVDAVGEMIRHLGA
jgi:flagellar biosynthetic protein FliR